MKCFCFRDLFATCLLFFCCVNLVQGQNLENGDNTFTDLLRSETYGLSAESIEEIVQIRQRLGGGTRLEIADPFTRMNASPKPAPITRSYLTSVLVCEPPDPASSASESERLFFEMIEAVSEPTMNCRTAELADGCDEDIAALRSVARRIDELAAELEEINQFEHADSLRLRATSLRQQARFSNRSADSNTLPLR